MTWNPFRLFSKRFLAGLNWIFFRKKHFFENQLEPLPALFEKLGVDLVLLGGDFSTTALNEEFEKATQFVQKIKQPWLAVPGNHDTYTKRSDKHKRFYRFFSNKQKGLLALKTDGIEAHQINPHYWVILLDTSLATGLYSSQGLFSKTIEERLETVLKQIPETDSILLLNHYPFFQNGEKRHGLIRAEALKALLHKDPRIRIYLHGHTHRHTVADLQVSNLPLVLDSGSCAQGKKGAWNLIDLKEGGCTVSTYRWDHNWTKTRTEEFSWTRK